MVDETRAEVRKLLEEESNFSTRAGLRLVLTMLMEIDEKYEAQKAQHDELKIQVDLLKRKNIIIWAQGNRFLAGLYLFLLCVISNAWFVSGFRKPAIVFIFKHIFGVDLPIEAVP